MSDIDTERDDYDEREHNYEPLLDWEFQTGVTKRWRGFLKGHPETTLFVCNLSSERDDRCHLMGAVMSDTDDRAHVNVKVHWAKSVAAEMYMRDFIDLVKGL